MNSISARSAGCRGVIELVDVLDILAAGSGQDFADPDELHLGIGKEDRVVHGGRGRFVAGDIPMSRHVADLELQGAYLGDLPERSLQQVPRRFAQLWGDFSPSQPSGLMSINR